MSKEQLPLEEATKQINRIPDTHISPPLTAIQGEPSLMNLIANMATDSGADVAKLEKLIELQNSVLDREAKKEFARDFIKMKPRLPRVISLHKNTQTSSMYAKLEDINRIIDPILAEFNFATQHKIVAQTEKLVTVRVELWHVSGHIESTDLSMPLDDAGLAGKTNKTAVHAIASTIMYLRRVGECALLNISTGQDTDGNTTKGPITMEAAALFDTRLRSVSDKALPNFLKWAGFESITDLPANLMPKWEKAISNMEAEASAAKVKS